MILELPWPDKKLSPNSRLHHMVLAAAKKAYREQCRTIASQSIPTLPEGRIRLEIMFYPPANRGYDIDGLLSRMKSGIDGVATAWGIDDVRFRPILIDIGHKRQNGVVEITIKTT